MLFHCAHFSSKHFVLVLFFLSQHPLISTNSTIFMDIDSTIQEKDSGFTMLWNQLKGFPRKLMDKISNIANNTINIGKDDPRKIWHAAKVGLCLTLLILFYYSWPLYHSFEQSAIMAVLTVTVAFEYTAGATISKCLNIAFATLLGVSLGVGAEYLAKFCGKEGEPIILGILVFNVGALGTFTRFYPHMQRRYDYGCMFSVSTFSLVTVSGDNYLELVKQRISTIMVSVATVIVISLVICPVWAGKDLHKLISDNLEKLASFLDEFEREYFQAIGEGSNDKEKGSLEAFKSVLGSKAIEESLANFAWWEPVHNPGKEYLKIGNLGRDLACHLHVLSGHLKAKSKALTEFHRRTEEASKKIIMECSNALKDLAFSIKTMTRPASSIAKPDPYNTKIAIGDLRSALLITKTTFSEEDTIDVITTMSVASTLIDVAGCVDEISKAVGELSVKARFPKEEKNKDNSMLNEALGKSSTPRLQFLHRGIVSAAEKEEGNPIGAIKGEHVVCEIHAIEEQVVIGVDDRIKDKFRI